MSRKASMVLAKPEEIEITLTITLPAYAWRRVMERENWNPFQDVVRSALANITDLSADTEIEP